MIAFNNDARTRSALTLARSQDAGASWHNLAVLEDDPLGSFSYPTLLYDTAKVCMKLLLI